MAIIIAFLLGLSLILAPWAWIILIAVLALWALAAKAIRAIRTHLKGKPCSSASSNSASRTAR